MVVGCVCVCVCVLTKGVISTFLFWANVGRDLEYRIDCYECINVKHQPLLW